MPAPYIDELRALGVPYFPSPDRALRALRHLTAHAERCFARVAASPIALELPRGTVPEYLAKELLGPAGIPFPKGSGAVALDGLILAD